uniref:Terminase, large subunit n=1 Tax=Myoviridae sp. ctp7F23 TaxID=2825174 RepID=A0A8S5U8P5_9CAUD|nr:MAG TPA: terminase large subunit [Myoviridae sp. ctp7F23]
MYMELKRKRIQIRKYSVAEYQKEAMRQLQPPENLTVSEWAEKYRMLDSKTSAMPGPWRNEKTPYLKEIMDEFINYDTEEIIFCKPSQVGGTEAMQNMLGYVIQQDPSPTLIVYPTDTLAESISKNRLEPMIRASKPLRKLYNENESSKLELQFDGMYLSLNGANSPSALASKAIKYLFLDEVDKYPGASKKEADPIRLARERTKTFTNQRKIYMTSTPTLQTGHIWQALQGADIEKHYFVPCPHCGEYIELKFSNLRFPSGDDLDNSERADMAVYVCQECGCKITDQDRDNMIRYGEWREVRRNTKASKKVAFWINTLYSPFVRFSEIVKEFLDSKDNPDLLQNFVNSWLAEPWEDTKLKTDADMVMERQTDLPQLVVPSWARYLTAGVDVQETCLYWTIRAWGPYITSQNIAHGQALSFQDIESTMNTPYLTESGEQVIVSLCLIDSGYDADSTYDFCATNSEWAMPVKGASNPMMSHFKTSKINKVDSKAYGMNLVLVDGDKYKDMIASRMRKDNGKGAWMVYEGCDREYAEQVTSEHKVNEKSGSRIVQRWRPKHSHIDNHYLDCEVYSLAAADILGVRMLHLQVEAERKEQLQRQQEERQETPEENWIRANEQWV